MDVPRVRTRAAARAAKTAAIENAAELVPQKVHGTKRRALQDIGNVSQNQKSGAPSKGGTKAAKTTGGEAPKQQQPQPPQQQQQQQPPPQQQQREQQPQARAKAAQAQAEAPRRPFTRAQARAAMPAASSLSSLLQARSHAASTSCRTTAAGSGRPDVDSDRGDPLACCDYVDDIYAYYRRVEHKFLADPEYMSRQADINERMRAILIDWLVDVHLKFKLMPETIFLATNLVDRYMAVQQVTRGRLQLVGIAALLIASKYEEVWAPTVRDFVYVSDRAYTKCDILEMEKDMLNTVGFNLTLPTTYTFLARLLKVTAAVRPKVPCARLALYVAYIAELAMMSYKMLEFSHSIISTAAICVGLSALDPKSYCYPPLLAQHAGGYTSDELEECMKEILWLLKRAGEGSLQAVRSKYSTPKFLEVAGIPPPIDMVK